MNDKPIDEVAQVRAEAKRNVDEAYRTAIATGSSVAIAMEGIIFYAQEVIDLARQYLAKDMAQRAKGRDK